MQIITALKILMRRKAGFEYPWLYFVFLFLGWKFDILNCHYGPMGIIGAFLKQTGTGGRLVTHFHGYDIAAYVGRKGGNVYDELFRTGDLFLTSCKFFKKQLVDLGCDEKKIKWHASGIDVERFEAFAGNQRPEKPIRILTVGRLVEKKGCEYAIKAMEKVVAARKDIIYSIAGDGPLRAELQRLTKELSLENHVRFLGAVEQAELIEFYRQSHILVAPSITARDGDQESTPNVLKEALVLGLPVVSTLHCGIPELVIDGQSGFLVPEKDVDALAEKIIYLVEHPEIRPGMAKSGREFVLKNYNIKTLNSQLARIYQNLIQTGAIADLEGDR